MNGLITTMLERIYSANIIAHNMSNKSDILSSMKIYVLSFHILQNFTFIS